MKATIPVSLSVDQNHFFSKTADRILNTNFIQFSWFLKDKKVMQLGKNLIFGKKHETSLKVGLLELEKKLFH